MTEADRAYLLDMLIQARHVRRFVAGIEQPALVADAMRWYAVLHAFTLLGEAANRVSPETRAALPTIDWPKAVGMRNRLVHEYGRVKAAIVWSTAHEVLPALIPVLESAIGPEQEEGL